MAGEGRPTLCTPKLTKVVAEGLRKGLGVRASVARAGIVKETHYNWLERGRTGEKPFVDYLDSCERAHAEFVENKLTQIDAAADKEWTASAWRLERLDPQEFGRKDRTEVDVKGDVHLSISGLSEAEAAILSKLTAKLVAKPGGDEADRDPG